MVFRIHCFSFYTIFVGKPSSSHTYIPAGEGGLSIWLGCSRDIPSPGGGLYQLMSRCTRPIEDLTSCKRELEHGLPGSRIHIPVTHGTAGRPIWVDVSHHGGVWYVPPCNVRLRREEWRQAAGCSSPANSSPAYLGWISCIPVQLIWEMLWNGLSESNLAWEHCREPAHINGNSPGPETLSILHPHGATMVG